MPPVDSNGKARPASAHLPMPRPELPPPANAPARVQNQRVHLHQRVLYEQSSWRKARHRDKDAVDCLLVRIRVSATFLLRLTAITIIRNEQCNDQQDPLDHHKGY